jgi:hypothetical protein
MSKPLRLIAGDCIIDWVIHDGKITPKAGGAGNIVRGLMERGHNVSYLTVYNPMLYPLNAVLPVHRDSLTDFTHRNVFVRDYNNGVFHRYRESLREKVFDVKDAFAVICHEDSCVRRFSALYADVRDPKVRGKCDILRMSSSDPWEEIMRVIDFKMAVVTYKDKLEVFNSWEALTETIIFRPVAAIDDIGAGDTFDVGFLDWFVHNEGKSSYEGFKYAMSLAQEKVQQIGVFMNE